MRLILKIIISGLAVFITAYIIPGIKVDSFLTAIIAAVVLGIANGVLKPILLLLTLPINLMTLGLFTFVVNALIVLLVSKLVPGFQVAGFLPALLFGLVLSIVNAILQSLVKD